MALTWTCTLDDAETKGSTAMFPSIQPSWLSFLLIKWEQSYWSYWVPLLKVKFAEIPACCFTPMSKWVSWPNLEMLIAPTFLICYIYIYILYIGLNWKSWDEPTGAACSYILDSKSSWNHIKSQFWLVDFMWIHVNSFWLARKPPVFPAFFWASWASHPVTRPRCASSLVQRCQGACHAAISACQCWTLGVSLLKAMRQMQL